MSDCLVRSRFRVDANDVNEWCYVCGYHPDGSLFWTEGDIGRVRALKFTRADATMLVLQTIEMDGDLSSFETEVVPA